MSYLPAACFQAPFYTVRAEAWQTRVMQAASSFFLPAEMADLRRIGLRFVPQEADRIKRHLRRKTDYFVEPSDPYAAQPRPDLGPDHPTFTQDPNARAGYFGNQGRREAAEGTAGTINANRTLDTNYREGRAIPNQNRAGFPQETPADGGVRVAGRREDGAVNPVDPARNAWVRTANPNSLLRRTQLFIGSVFVFDLAHALLRHLRQEVISLTANGTEADETLLRQIIRNVRGMTFRELVPLYRGNYKRGDVGPGGRYDIMNKYNRTPGVNFNVNGWDGDMYNNQAAIDRAVVKVTKDVGGTVDYMPMKIDSYDDFKDIATPLSTTELNSLRLHGYCRHGGKYYTPHRLPEWLGVFLGDGRWPRANRLDNADLYMTNERRLTALRNQGQYPSAFLTNGVVADDLSAARLTEHCNAKQIDPRFFTWEMRKNVFIPLELDVMDITRLGDLQHYARLSEILNSFGTGLYQGMDLRSVFGELNKGYENLKSDVPLNMLPAFTNVAKQIQLPASPSAPRRTFANEEVMRLFIAADDVLRIVAQWYMTAGVLDRINFDDYRHPDPESRDYYEQILGNRPDAQQYGENVWGQKNCPPGMQTAYFTGPPGDKHRRMLPPGAEVLPGGGVNPEARHMECVPMAITQPLLINDAEPPVVAGEDVVMAAVEDDRGVAQKKAKKHRSKKK